MVEQEWMKFASTGCIQDYLSYKSHQKAEGIYEDAADLKMVSESTGRSVTGYGADHSADRHGAVSSPRGGI